LYHLSYNLDIDKGPLDDMKFLYRSYRHCKHCIMGVMYQL